LTVTQAASDAAKRISDEMTMHALAHAEGWVCFRLSDGTPLDHAVYARRIEAVKAAGWDCDRFIYLEVQPDAMTPRNADAVLAYARALHDAGFRIPSPEFEYDPTMPLMRHDRIASIRHLASGGTR
jgi:hypothetical protein